MEKILKKVKAKLAKKPGSFTDVLGAFAHEVGESAQAFKELEKKVNKLLEDLEDLELEKFYESSEAKKIMEDMRKVYAGASHSEMSKVYEELKKAIDSLG